MNQNRVGHDGNSSRIDSHGTDGSISSGNIGGTSRLQHYGQPQSCRTRDVRIQQQVRSHIGSVVKPPHSEPADLVRRALDFKTQGTQCYKDKKYREAIGKYHRALLEMKGLCRVFGDPDASCKSPSSTLATISKTPLTDEQKGAMENAELECYNSLAGKLTITDLFYLPRSFEIN